MLINNIAGRMSVDREAFFLSVLDFSNQHWCRDLNAAINVIMIYDRAYSVRERAARPFVALKLDKKASHDWSNSFFMSPSILAECAQCMTGRHKTCHNLKTHYYYKGRTHQPRFQISDFRFQSSMSKTTIHH